MSHPLSPPVQRKPLQQVIRFFSSFGLATVLLIFLLLTTLLGTLEQTEHFLFDTVHKYFDSWFVWEVDLGCCVRAFNLPSPGHLVLSFATIKDLPWQIQVPFVLAIFAAIFAVIGIFIRPLHRLWQAKVLIACVGVCLVLGYGKGLPILPGGILLMSVLFVNMLLGAIIRIKLRPNKIGVIISHLSILFMLVAGLVSLLFKTEGALALHEGQTSDEYQAYHESVIEIERLKPEPAENKRVMQVIDGSEYQDLAGDKARMFTNDKLPFDLIVMDYAENAEPRRLKPGESRIPQADGYYIQPKASEKEQEKNLDAAYVKVVDKKTKTEQAGIIWRAELAPYTFKIGEEVYGISMTRRFWKLPFAVRLDKAEEEMHPGTDMARRFESRITKIEGKHEVRKLITMNEPLRQPADHFWDGNYVLFQANFASQQGGPAQSVFTVVRNPSDYWPLWALLGAMAGLLIHMLQRLIHFLTRARRNRPHVPPPSAPIPVPV